MNFFVWLFIGVSLGFATHYFRKKEVHGGLMGALFLGTLGALEGGFFPSLLLNHQASSITVESIFLSVLGASILLVIWQMFGGDAVERT